MSTVKELRRNMIKDLEHYLASCGYVDAKDRAARDVDALIVAARTEESNG